MQEKGLSRFSILMNAPLVPPLVAQPGSRLFGVGRPAVLLLWPAAVIMALAVVAQSLSSTSADVSWLITLCEKTLDGERPYTDFIESNPPAAFLIYMPAAWAARLVGARPEFLAAVFAFIAITASLALCSLILDRAGLASRLGAAGLAVAVIALALLPSRSFNQREHLALIFGLPFLAALAARASGTKAENWLGVAAGFGAALMAAIKPHFALTLLAPFPYFVYRAGMKDVLRSAEVIAFLCAAAACAALTVIVFPAYLQRIVPIVATVYVPVRTPILGLLLNQGFLCWSGLAVCLVSLGRNQLNSCLVAVPALASTGAIAAFLIQGKGWPYHSYPAIALMTLGLSAAILEAKTTSRRLRTLFGFSVAGATAIVFALAQPFNDTNAPLERLVAALAPHPKVLVIGPDIALGFPLTRNVAGSWAGTPMDLWITASIDFLTRHHAPDPATRDKYDSYLRFDRETLVADIRKKSPDAILVQNEKWETWAFAHADVAAALADYAPVGAVGEVLVYGRRLGLRPSQGDQ